MHPGMLPTKQSTATSRYPQSKRKYTNPKADITQESTTTWHDGPDPQTKKKIPFRLNPTRTNNINYYKPCHCITSNEVTENSQRELIL